MQKPGCQYCGAKFRLEERECRPVSFTEKEKSGRSMRWTTRLFCNNDCMEKFKKIGPKANEFKYVIQ